MLEEGRSTNAPNIVVFGQTGSGKSSLINMLARKNVAEVSSEVMGCTTTAQSYNVKTYTFWDTSGLNEGDEGRVPALKAIDDLFDLVKKISVSLIIYCVRGRLTDIVRVNYDLFCGIICEGKVPVVFVVTGLEQEKNMDQWWTKHEKDIKRLRLTFEDYACVTTIKGRNNIYEQEYRESRDKVWKLVEEYGNSAPWTLTPEWLDKVPKTLETYVAQCNARTGKERKVLPVSQRSRLLGKKQRRAEPYLKTLLTNYIIRKGHAVLFGSINFVSIIEMCIAAWVTAQFTAKHNAPNTETQDRVRFVLFASVWSIIFCMFYIVLFLKAATSKYASVASHVAFLSITWIFWLAAAASMTTAPGGMLNCSTDTSLVYCGQLKTILGVSWTIWILVTLTLIGALLCAIQASRRGGGLFGSLVDY